METKNIDLAYKGDWFEQNAEFAEKCNDRVMMEKSYRRAIEFYELGGWIEQALNVARKINDSGKIGELESKLKIMKGGAS